MPNPHLSSLQTKENIIDDFFYKWVFAESLWGTLLIERTTKTILKWNKSSISMLLCDANMEAPLNTNLSQFIPDESLGFKIITDELLDQNGLFSECCFKRSDNNIFLTQISIKHLPNKENYILLVFHDISEQKKLQRDLELKQDGYIKSLNDLTEMNKELLKLDQAKTKFLALITHELRTPLSTIIATGDILNSGYFDGETEFKELTKNLLSQAQHLQVLVNDILDLTKIQSGKMEFFIVEEDVAEQIIAQKWKFSEMASKNNVSIDVQTSKKIMKCFFDPVRFEQIMSNLISNAIKFSKQDTQIEIRAQDSEDYILISVKDHGIGISPNNFESIFNEFETLEEIAKHHKGTGLGLPIVKKLVEAQGGKIYLESELNKGSTFYVSLPKKKILAPEVYRARAANSEEFIFF